MMTKKLIVLISLVLLAAALTNCRQGSTGKSIDKFMDYQWQPIGPGGGGWIGGPGISPHDDNLLFSASDMGGAFRSGDGGRSWTFLNGSEIRALNRRFNNPWGFHPTDANLIFAGARIGFLRSRDGGISWEKIKGPWDAATSDIMIVAGWKSSSKGPHVIKFDMQRPAIGIAAFNDYININKVKLFRTNDNGETWSKLNDLPARSGDVYDIVFDAQTEGTIIVGCANGIFASLDGGKTWITRNNSLKQDKNEVKLSGFTGASTTDRTVLYATVPTRMDRGNCTTPIYTSTDLGLSWEPVARNCGLFIDIRDKQTPQYRQIVACGSDPNITYVGYRGIPARGHAKPPQKNGNGGMFGTRDGGKSWTEVIFRHPGQPRLNQNRVWRNDPECGNVWGWNQEPPGIAVSDTNSNLVFTSWEVANDGGQSWFRTDAGQLTGCATPAGGMQIMTSWNHYVDPHDRRRHYTANTDFVLWRSIDNGASWQLCDARVNNIYAMAFDPNIPGRIWAAGSLIHDIPYREAGPNSKGVVSYSTNYGQNWTRLDGFPDQAVLDIWLDPKSAVDSRTLWIAIMGEGFYKSPDGGRTWGAKNNGIDIKNKNAYRIDRDTYGRLFAIVTGKFNLHVLNPLIPGNIYISYDDGESWKAIGDTAKMPYPIDIAIDPLDPNVIYVTCFSPFSHENSVSSIKGGLWKTTDGGASWTKIFEGECFSVALWPNDNNMVFVSAGFNWKMPDNVGVYVSDDAGLKWHKIDALAISRPHRFTFDSTTTPATIIVTSFGQGLWRGTPHSF